MKLIRKFKLGHLYFKYVQGTPLELSPFNTSKKLACEMVRQGMVELFKEGLESGDLVPTDNAKNATWYAYCMGMEPTKNELIKLLTKDAA